MMNPNIDQIKRLLKELSDDKLLHVIDSVEELIEAREDNTYVEETNSSDNGRANLPRLQQLVDWGYVNIGDVLFVRGHEDNDKKSTLVSRKAVEYHGETMSCRVWSKVITGWSAVNIYEWVMVERVERLLGEVRDNAMRERGID